MTDIRKTKNFPQLLYLYPEAFSFLIITVIGIIVFALVMCWVKTRRKSKEFDFDQLPLATADQIETEQVMEEVKELQKDETVNVIDISEEGSDRSISEDYGSQQSVDYSASDSDPLLLGYNDPRYKFLPSTWIRLKPSESRVNLIPLKEVIMSIIERHDVGDH